MAADCISEPFNRLQLWGTSPAFNAGNCALHRFHASRYIFLRKMQLLPALDELFNDSTHRIPSLPIL